MGSTGMPFGRNVEFEATFPDLGRTELARNRHGGRLGLLRPDPQVISRRLLSRPATSPDTCHEGRGLPGHSAEAHCDYKKAPFLNVLAAFWIQFMTHDWFSHLDEGRNSSATMTMGCAIERIDGVERPLTREAGARLGCRAEDRADAAAVAEASDPPVFAHRGQERLARAFRTTRNTVTAWWDASQLYGHDDASHRRVRRDPADPARLQMVALGARSAPGDRLGYLPVFEAGDPINPRWSGQETTAFPDNWSIGLSFFHNVFAREHNLFVEAFRSQAAATPDADSGLRHPERPDRVVRYRDVSADELFEATRLVIAAEIAKIHTIEWTPQLLYNEPLGLALRANWFGLADDGLVRAALSRVLEALARSRERTGRPPGTRSSPRGRASSGSATARISTAPPPAGRARRGPTPGASGIPTTSTAGRTTSARRSASPRSS